MPLDLKCRGRTFGVLLFDRQAGLLFGSVGQVSDTSDPVGIPAGRQDRPLFVSGVEPKFETLVGKIPNLSGSGWGSLGLNFLEAFSEFHYCSFLRLLSWELYRQK